MNKRDKEIYTGQAQRYWDYLGEISELCGNPIIGYYCYPKEGMRIHCGKTIKALAEYTKYLSIPLKITLSTQKELDKKHLTTKFNML